MRIKWYGHAACMGTSTLPMPLAVLSSRDEFIKGKDQVRLADGPEIEITRESLPKVPEIVVLKHAG